MGKLSDWLFGGKTYARSSTNNTTGSTEHSVHSLEGTPEEHDHSWVRTTTYPSGATRTVMGETGRDSVARDERRESRGESRDRDRENR